MSRARLVHVTCKGMLIVITFVSFCLHSSPPRTNPFSATKAWTDRGKKIYMTSELSDILKWGKLCFNTLFLWQLMTIKICNKVLRYCEMWYKVFHMRTIFYIMTLVEYYTLTTSLGTVRPNILISRVRRPYTRFL